MPWAMSKGRRARFVRRELMSMMMITMMLLTPCAQFGWTSLMLACDNGHFRVAHALLAAGADKDAKCNVGCILVLGRGERSHTKGEELLPSRGRGCC